MNRIDIQPPLVSIEEDFALWCAQQGALLRAGRLAAIDRENLAEEIESLGRSDRREIGNRLKVLLAHLLKWRFQPERQKGDWRATIRNQRVGIAKLIKESPSLANYPASVLREEYENARADAADETALSEETFPAECPFTIDQVLDPDWLPDAA